MDVVLFSDLSCAFFKKFFPDLLVRLTCTPLWVNNTFTEYKSVSFYFVGLSIQSCGSRAQGAVRNKWLVGRCMCHFPTSASASHILPKFIKRALFTFLSLLSLKADDWWWLLSPEVRSDRGKEHRTCWPRAAMGNGGKGQKHRSRGTDR